MQRWANGPSFRAPSPKSLDARAARRYPLVARSPPIPQVAEFYHDSLRRLRRIGEITRREQKTLGPDWSWSRPSSQRVKKVTPSPRFMSSTVTAEAYRAARRASMSSPRRSARVLDNRPPWHAFFT